MARAGSDLFIVDNSDSDWKVRRYLHDWCHLSKAIDVATGFFEIGGLLALEGAWQTVPQVRILMGDEVSKRTKSAFAEGLRQITERLDTSIEGVKRADDFLHGVPAIVDALRSGQIQCRVYRKDKFHAKAYITHAEQEVVGSAALVGSSNLTVPGICDNVELNVQITGAQVGALQEWYDRHWDQAEDVAPEILRTIEHHTRERTPFEVWFKGLHEFLRAHELTPDEWDRHHSTIFHVLARYQQDAYKNMVEIANRFGGAFLCDGVGLGKSFVGLMLIERMVVREGKRVALFAPKAAREDVWEPLIERYLPDLRSGFVNILLYNHTDLQRQSTRFLADLGRTLKDADIVLIDEAHHFRNTGVAGTGKKAPSRYRKLQQFLHQEGGREKQLFLLTATPINNSIHDFRRIVELFTNAEDGYFARGVQNLGIHSLRRHFVDLERSLLASSGTPAGEQPVEIGELGSAMRSEPLFERLVVQRSRSFVKDSQQQEDPGSAGILFPERQPPRVAGYRLKATYGRLLDEVGRAFDRDDPLFVLGIYYPLAYWTGPQDAPEYESFNRNRQKQVVALIRTQFLKRFESSAKAFEMSCYRLLKKLLAWMVANIPEDDSHNQGRLKRWKSRNAALIGYVEAHQLELWHESGEEAPTEDFLTDEEIELAEQLDPGLYDLEQIFDHTLEDLDQLAHFLELVAKVEPAKDDKLAALKRLLGKDKQLSANKVIVFTEFGDTARYLENELNGTVPGPIERIDGGSSQKQRSDAIRRFSPYYNGSSAAELAAAGKQEIRVLLATDILAEGLNLQDACHLINYDIHWNPVRLMQRVGRVDRRMNPETEAHMAASHPELSAVRGKVFYWNFLPPDELDDLLRLYTRVSHKTLTISKTLGVDTGKLFAPDDVFEQTRELNKLFDGEQSDVEILRLEYQRLLREHPGTAATLDGMPLKVFSGREHPDSGTKALFLCFRIPGPDPALVDAPDGAARWSDSAGYTVWMLLDPTGNALATDPTDIADVIRSLPETPRVSSLVIRKRASANKAERAAFAAEDLLFITCFGTRSEPEIAFAHFHQENERSLPVLVFCGALTPADFQTAFRRLEEQSRELEAAQVEPVSGLGKKPRPATSPDS